MSFLSKIFQPKPGGTFVGNLLRGLGVNKAPIPAFTGQKLLPGEVEVDIGGKGGVNIKSGGKLTEQPWFWPVVIGTGGLFLIVLLVLMFKKK